MTLGNQAELQCSLEEAGAVVLDAGVVKKFAEGFDSLLAGIRLQISAECKALERCDSKGHNVDKLWILRHFSQRLCDPLVEVKAIGDGFAADKFDGLLAGGHDGLLSYGCVFRVRGHKSRKHRACQ